MRQAGCLACFAALLFGAAVNASHAQPGRITIPARGLLDLQEGTVEAWVLFQFDPAQREEGVWRPMGSWFTWEIPTADNDLGAGMMVSYGLRNGGTHGKVEPACNMRVGFAVDGQEVPHPVFADCTKLGQNQWHHFAATWRDGKFLRVYVDGKLAAERDFPWSIVRDIPPSARLVIGHTGYGRSWLAIDEVRVSSIARRPEDLGCHHVPLAPDPFTTLLENFEDAPEKKIVGGKLVEGKTGKGFALE
jgi:hypothetical protein